MTHEDFDARLRQGLATLAREAIPDDVARAEPVPRLPSLHDDVRRRRPRRVLAALVAAVLLVGAVVAIATRGDKHAPHLETPQPVWTKVARFPLVARSAQAAVFTGHEVIVWGGRSESAGNSNVASPAGPGTPREALGDGAVFDVSADRWRVLPAAPVGPRFEAVAAWTGTEMLVVGGRRDGTGPGGGIEFLRDGAAYDPAHHRWRRLPDAPGCPAFGTWTGRVLVVGGYCNGPGPSLVMAAYDPARNAWTTLPSYADANQLVAAGGRVFAWSLTNRGAVLDLVARTWTPLPALPAPGRAYRPSSLAVAYEGHLAVASLLQRPSENLRDTASVDILDLAARSWRHYETTAVEPASDGFEIAAGGGALLWLDGLSFNWFVGPPGARTPSWSGAIDRSGPVWLGSSGESVVPIGGRRFFIGGGRLAGGNVVPKNRTTPDGAILQLP